MNGICINSYTANQPLKDVQFVIDVHAECSGETNTLGLMLFFMIINFDFLLLLNQAEP